VRLVTYGRTSGTGNGDSLDAQEQACRVWAEANGHEIIAVCQDDGVCGAYTPEEREGLAEALALVEDREVSGMVVRELDRLARELHVQEAVLARVWTAGGRVFEAARDGEVLRDDPDDPMRTAMRQMAGVFAQLERGVIALRLRRGRRRKRASGGYTGGPTVAFGQRVEGEGRDARLVADPQTLRTVEAIQQLRRSGLTLAAIADRLNAEGAPTPRGGRWHITSVRRVLMRAESRSSGQ
jgi:DNA invertase Pin-like site-specific DNA recombinase